VEDACAVDAPEEEVAEEEEVEERKEERGVMRMSKVYPSLVAIPYDVQRQM